jgi:hypothetical protein
MIKSRILFGVLSGSFLILAVVQSVAQAQLFGNQTIGSSPSQLRSPFGNVNQGARGTTSLGAPTGQPGQPGQPGGIGPGLLDGNERFVRGNRSRQDFVGTGRNDLTGFVGAGQAIGVGRVPAATDSFRLEAMNAARVNKPLPKQPAKGMYYPRLVLELETKTGDLNLGTAASAASPEIQRRVKNAGGEKVQIVVAGSTAILRGSVDSKRTAELVVIVLSFEPGIDRVESQMTIQ